MSSFSSRFPRNPIQWIAVLVPIFICLSISGSGYFSFHNVPLLFIYFSIFLIKFTKENQVLKDETESQQIQVQPLCSEQSLDCQVKENGRIFQENGTELVDDCLANGSPDSYSESEVIDQYSSSEDSDTDWPFSANVAGSPDFSDGPISDEESLIEIALPSGHYVGSTEEEGEEEDEDDDDDDDDKVKWDLHRRFKDFSAEAIFGKRSLMEMLAEINDMNEEDNMIEIDISVGSIKCSRFEIEA